LNSEESTSTYKSEARASPPGLSIRIITALYLFDSEEKRRLSVTSNYERYITKKNKDQYHHPYVSCLANNIIYEK